MSGPKPSHPWFKLFSHEWLTGSLRFDLDAAERGVWADLLAMANESRAPGVIQQNENQAYPHHWLAHTFHISPSLLEKTLKKCIASGRISENGFGIRILNWHKYQESKKGTKAEDESPDPTVTVIALAVEKERGYVSPSYPAEAKDIKWMLVHGYSQEDILACYRAMLREKFWQDKPLLMTSVRKQIGQWKKGPQEPPGLAGLPEVTA